MYNEGETTHYGQIIENDSLKRCWQEMLKRSDYHNRLQHIMTFNRFVIAPVFTPQP